MPWKINSIFGERLRFVRAALQQRQPFNGLCRRFGVSRRTGYKWCQRFQRDPLHGLRDRSRKPRTFPGRLSTGWQQQVRRLGQRYPRWGAKKIYARLGRDFRRAGLPAVRTIGKWLGKLCPRPRRPRHTRRGPRVDLPPLTQPTKPNEVWTVDFKGFFRTNDGVRCDPLTVRDLFSRYLLDVRILPHQRQRAVRRVFLRLFRRYGLPRVIRMDNGSPFGSTAARGLSSLSVWWLTLGIAVEFIRPGHPEENGAHEQMHRELKRDTAKPPAAHGLAQQRRSDRWRFYYNAQRPHEALGGRYPADLYRRNPRRYRHPVAFKYPQAWRLRRVRHNGQIKWQGRLRSIGEPFAGHTVALRSEAQGIYKVYFRSLLLGTLHDRDASGIRPVKLRRAPASVS